MIVSKNEINMAGLCKEVIDRYCQTKKVKKMIEDIMNGDKLPPIIVYKKRLGRYTIADGIHRFCAYLSMNVEMFNVLIK